MRKGREHLDIGAGHPGLGAEREDFLEQGAAAFGIEMGGDLVQQKDRSAAFPYMGKLPCMCKHDGDEEGLLLASRTFGGIGAFDRVAHQKVRAVWTETRPSSFRVAHTGAQEVFAESRGNVGLHGGQRVGFTGKG